VIHLGSQPRAPRLREYLFAQALEWLPPTLSDVEPFCRYAIKNARYK
jgi:hypothetical protein